MVPDLPTISAALLVASLLGGCFAASRAPDAASMAVGAPVAPPGVDPDVAVLCHGGGVRDVARVLAVVRSLPGVAGADPFVYVDVTVGAPGASVPGGLWGLDPAHPYLAALSAPRADAGGPGILLGPGLADTLGVAPGDTLRVDLVGVDPPPVATTFRVAGTAATGPEEVAWTWVTMADAQRLLGWTGEVTGVAVRLAPAGEPAHVARSIEDALGYPYFARTRAQLSGG